MGLYNTVVFSCPKCSGRIEEQSKAEEGFREFYSSEVPELTAIDILGGLVWCKDCNISYQIVNIVKPNTMQLGLARV